MKIQQLLNELEKGEDLKDYPDKLGFSYKRLRNLLSNISVSYNIEKRKWEYSTDIIKPFLDIDLQVMIKFSYIPLKPNNLNIWKCEKECITKEEVIEILKCIESRNPSTLKKLDDEKCETLSLYITDYLDHPLDALLVTPEIAKTIKSSYVLPRHLVRCINIVGLYIAFKYKLKLPIEVTSMCFSNFRIKSIVDRGLDYDGDKVKIDINYYIYPLLKFIENIEIVEYELNKFINTENKYKGAIGSNLYYYIIILLLRDNTKNPVCKTDFLELDYNDLDIINIAEINKFIKFNLPDNVAMNFLYYLKFGMKRLFLSSKFTEILDYYRSDEIELNFLRYKLYILSNSRSVEQCNRAFQMNSHKPENLKKINQLTLSNLKLWIDNYITHCLKVKITKSFASDTINIFCKVLYEMKTILEEDKYNNIVVKFPFKLQEIRNNNGKIYRWKNAQRENDIGDNCTFSKTLMEYGKGAVECLENQIRKGTLKEDIDIADRAVRAIYNYKFKGKEGTIEFFKELQYITMLRIIADSGVRYSEVINMMFGTLSYLEEEDCYICILGWSKVFDRFGVVPISKETADMIKKCVKIRREQFPESLLVELEIMDSTKSKAKIETKAVLQFVNIIGADNDQRKAYRRIGTETFKAFYKQLLEEAGVQVGKGKLFHVLRHRAAEYFFFCLSYYDFEYKNDYEYKEQVVKRLLRHRSINMTKEYNWSRLLDILSEGKLVFLKSLPDLANYNNKDSKVHEKSIRDKINLDLKDIVSDSNIEKIIKFLTVPFGFIGEDVIEKISKEKSFKIFYESLSRVDGNKGFVPEGAASFGLCMNFSCPKLFINISCLSCNDHILEEKDIPIAIREIIRCYQTINDIYKNRYDDATNIDHLKSLRSRITSLLERIDKELNIPSIEILDMITSQLNVKSHETYT